MKPKILMTAIVAAMVTTAACSVSQQNDEVPLPVPQTKPKAKNPNPMPPRVVAHATILVTCDFACTWQLDGDAMGGMEAGGMRKVSVGLGQHIVVGRSSDALDVVRKEITLSGESQLIVHLDIDSARQARLARENAARQANAEKARETAEVARQKAEIEAREAREHADEQARQAQALYDQERYAESKVVAQEACNADSMAGCRTLGLLYMYGDGTTTHYDKALWVLQKSCDGGDLRGCYALGTMYLDAMGVDPDYAKALNLGQRACDGNEMRGCRLLGWLYEEGKGVVQSDKAAFDSFNKACTGGLMVACGDLGRYYRDGRIVAPDGAKASSLFEKACDADNAESCVDLGDQDGSAGSVGYTKAGAIYRKDCDNGDIYGCHRLGELFLDGAFGSEKVSQSVPLLRSACGRQYWPSCTDLGDYSTNARQYQQAFEYYKESCDGGNDRGCTGLGILYDFGWGVKQDYGKARDLYDRPCRNGYLGL